MELLGPEYSLNISTLDSTTKVFLSRRLQSHADEDLIEKQNAEQGLMPIIANEQAEYGYENENRTFIQSFRNGVQPSSDFRAGLEVVELLMACYMSAEQERVVSWRPEGLETYQPAVARAAVE
jgi:predicted dehydrogenase